jgi:hypothetical protein
MTNLRYGGYLLLAMGFINLRYQTGHQGALLHSLAIVIPGLLLLLATFLKPTQEVLAKKNIQVIVAIIGVLLVGYSFIN